MTATRERETELRYLRALSESWIRGGAEPGTVEFAEFLGWQAYGFTATAQMGRVTPSHKKPRRPLMRRLWSFLRGDS